MTDPDYFTLAEFRALPGCTGSTFTDAQINAAASYFVQIVERETKCSFIPRSRVDNLRGDGSATLELSSADVRSLTSVTVAGVTVNVAGLDATSGLLRYATASAFGTTGWTCGAAVVVNYTAGRYATCPADVKDAVMWATRDRLLGQSDAAGIDIRKTSQSNDLGGVTTYILPGEKRPTGYPDLDAVIASYSRSAPAIGFA